MDQHHQNDDHEAILLARAYRLILSWPCPDCGQPFPCAHDLANDPDDTMHVADELLPDDTSKLPSAPVESSPQATESGAS